jgi:hypothetical protein
LRVSHLISIQIRQLPDLPANVRGPLPTGGRSLAERSEGLEQERDVLKEFYAGALPEELERLKPEERRRIYRMLRFEVSARSNGTLEARGILGENLRVGSEDGRAVCDPELAL